MLSLPVAGLVLNVHNIVRIAASPGGSVIVMVPNLVLRFPVLLVSLAIYTTT